MDPFELDKEFQMYHPSHLETTTKKKATTTSTAGSS